MEMTLDDLRRRYEAMPDADLAALGREGALTPKADGVLREVLAARGLTPEPIHPVGSFLPPPPPIFLPDLPKTWPGYLFAVAFLIWELFSTEGVDPILIVLSIGGWLYWLYCVRRLHDVLAAVTRNQYPISSGSALVRHFIPVYNFVWIVKWPRVLAEHLNGQGVRQALPPVVPGLLLLLFALLGRFVDGAVGLAGLFATLGYIVNKVRPTVELVEAVQEL